MDVRLVLLLAVCAVVVVDASSSSRYRPSGRCDLLCRRGVRSPFCRCRPRTPCDLKRCSRLARCVVRFGRGVCVPRRPYSYTPVACRAPKVVGRCRAAIPRYFYNTSTRRCEHFIYGGCGANSNNFLSLRECTSKCRRGARRSRDRD